MPGRTAFAAVQLTTVLGGIEEVVLTLHAALESPAGRHALRLAIVVPLAELLTRQLPLDRGYWMVVAAATVLRPEFGATMRLYERPFWNW